MYCQHDQVSCQGFPSPQYHSNLESSQICLPGFNRYCHQNYSRFLGKVQLNHWVTCFVTVPMQFPLQRSYLRTSHPVYLNVLILFPEALPHPKLSVCNLPTVHHSQLLCYSHSPILILFPFLSVCSIFPISFGVVPMVFLLHIICFPSYFSKFVTKCFICSC